MKMAMLAGRQTTALGFGCSLLGSTSTAVSRKLLNAAYDGGIRHFDVAPMYGFGHAERILREAFGKRIQEVTITTKYGLAPPRHSAWIAPVHRAARALLTPFPEIKKRLQRSSNGSQISGPPLTGMAARTSVEESLRQLGVDAIDLFLLHEATPARMADPDLLPTLERLRESGKIREFGIGSEAAAAETCLRDLPAFCRLVQCEWNVFATPKPLLDQVQGIRHGSLTGPRADFEQWLLADSVRAARWSEAAGCDLRAPAMMTKLIFKAALEHAWQHTGRIVLFSTRVSANVTSNIATAMKDELASPAMELHRLIAEEYRPQATFCV